MRDMTSMALVVQERDRPSPKVWQPWYMDESEGGGKELPTRTHRDQRTRDRLALARPPHRTTPSPERGCSSDDEINVVDSPPPPPHYAAAYYPPLDDDVPLDMTTKRRSPPPAHSPHHAPTSNSPSPPPYHPRPTYLPAPARARPTVITCVPPRYLSAHDLPPAEPAHLQHSHRDLPPAYSERPLPPPYSVATAHLSQQRALSAREANPAHPRPLPPPQPSSPAHRDASRPEDPPAVRRQVVQAGPVDPEIDEHFRRSLGKDYQQLFAATPPTPAPSTDSVDDHFAKALGETWVKLQAERRDSTASSSSSSSSTGSSSTSSIGVGGGGAAASRVSPARTSPPPAPRLIST